MLPRVSIIIPCFNYGAHIKETLASIEQEVCEEDEVIIVDDGSNDDTREVVANWIDGKKGFHYIYQDNAGPSAARNAGLDRARSEYVYFLDADDCPLPGKIDALKQAAGAHPEAAMVIGGHKTFKPSGQEKVHPVGRLSSNPKENFVTYTIHKRFSIANGGCVLAKTDIVRRYRYPESIRLSEDICLYSWILANHPCVTVGQIIIAIRKHEDSLRHQTHTYEKTVNLLPEILFDPRHLPPELMTYRADFEQHLKLSFFRAQFNAGQKKKARCTYIAAIKTAPLSIFKWSYLSKFLRTLLH